MCIVFPHMARNMLASCCQSVTRCLPHQTPRVTRAYAAHPQNSSRWPVFWVRTAIVMDNLRGSGWATAVSQHALRLLCKPCRDSSDVSHRSMCMQPGSKPHSCRCDDVNMNSNWIFFFLRALILRNMSRDCFKFCLCCICTRFWKHSMCTRQSREKNELTQHSDFRRDTKWCSVYTLWDYSSAHCRNTTHKHLLLRRKQSHVHL